MELAATVRRVLLVGFVTVAVLAALIKTLSVAKGHWSRVADVEAGFRPRRVLLSRDAGRVYAGGGNLVRCWKIPSGKLSWEASVPGEVGDIALEPSGGLLAVSAGERIVMFYDAVSGTEKGKLTPPGVSVMLLAFSPLGKHLLAAGARAVLWDAASGDVVWTSDLGGTTVAFSPDGLMIAGGGGGCEVSLWKSADGTHSSSIFDPRPGVRWVCFSPDGKNLGVASGSAGFAVYGLDGRERWRLTREMAGPAEFSPAGGAVAVAYPNSRIVCFLDVQTGMEKKRVEMPRNTIVSISFSPDGRYFAAADSSGSMRIWRRPWLW